MGKNETMADTARRYWAKKQKKIPTVSPLFFWSFFFIRRFYLSKISPDDSVWDIKRNIRRCRQKMLEKDTGGVSTMCYHFFCSWDDEDRDFFLSEKNNSVSTWFAEWNRRNWFRTRREEEKGNRAIEDTTLEDTEKRYRRVSLLFCFSHERETIRSANFGEWPPSRTTRPGPARRHCRFRK